MNVIDIQNEVSGKQVFANHNIINVCNSVLDNFSINNSEINIIISNDEHLRRLKKDFFDVDVYTDVISFNLEDDGEPIDGEVYISWDRINENAIELGQSSDSELKRIIIHGTLHLIGYEDQTNYQKENMTKLENKYLAINLKKVINN